MFYLFIFERGRERERERERESMSRDREKERDRESQAGSAPSMEPEAGLHPMNRGIVTRTETKSWRPNQPNHPGVPILYISWTKWKFQSLEFQCTSNLTAEYQLNFSISMKRRKREGKRQEGSWGGREQEGARSENTNKEGRKQRFWESSRQHSNEGPWRHPVLPVLEGERFTTQL